MMLSLGPATALACAFFLTLTAAAAAAEAPAPAPVASACPVTGKPPTKPTVPNTRCPAAASLSCCGDCGDLRYGLGLVTTNFSRFFQLVGATNPTLQNFSKDPYQLLHNATRGKDATMCTQLDQSTDSSDCSLYLEQLACAMTCNPDSGSYVAPSPSGGYTLTVCSGSGSFYMNLISKCSALIVPGWPPESGASNLEQFMGETGPQRLQEFAAAVAAIAGLGTFTAVAGPAPCFDGGLTAGGSLLAPSAQVCCDPLAVPRSCPAGAVNFTSHPSWQAQANLASAPSTCRTQPVFLLPTLAPDSPPPPSPPHPPPQPPPRLAAPSLSPPAAAPLPSAATPPPAAPKAAPGVVRSSALLVALGALATLGTLLAA